MKIQHHVKSALAVLAFAAASQASAGQISLDATGVPSYLGSSIGSGSYNYSGSFDGSALLPASFTINSVGFSFQFADNDDTLIRSQGVLTTTTSDPVTTSADKNSDATSTVTVTNKTTYTWNGPLEKATVSFGSLSIGGQTALFSSGTGSVLQSSAKSESYTYMQGNKTCTEEDYKQKNSSCKRTIHYTVTNNETEINTNNYTGNIALSGSLSASLLGELMNKKQLGFGINVTGDLNFLGAKLDIDYTPAAIPAGNDVPEPGSLALFGIALLGAAGVRRARRS